MVNTQNKINYKEIIQQGIPLIKEWINKQEQNEQKSVSFFHYANNTSSDCFYLNYYVSRHFSPHSTNWLTTNIISLQQWLVQLISEQIMIIQSYKEQTRILVLISLINWLNKLTRSLTELIYICYAVFNYLRPSGSFWAGTVITSFCHKSRASLSPFLAHGTPIPLIPMLVIIETSSLFIQSIVLTLQLIG